MAKNDKERRNYSREFKAEAVAPAGKKEKPVSRIAVDLGINENMLRRWIQQAREAATGRLPPFPGHGGPGTSRTLVRTYPSAEGSQVATGGGVKLRFTRNPKKSGRTLVRVIFAQTEGR
jgi:transposase-like protein